MFVTVSMRQILFTYQQVGLFARTQQRNGRLGLDDMWLGRTVAIIHQNLPLCARVWALRQLDNEREKMKRRSRGDVTSEGLW